MRRLLASLAVSLGALSALPATAGVIGIGDFSGSENVSTYDGLGIPLGNNATPIVIDGNTYTSDTGAVRYQAFFCLSNQCLSTAISETAYIDVDFGSSVNRVGFYTGFGGFAPWSADVGFYLGDGTVFTTTLSGVGLQFIGYESASGIDHVRIKDNGGDDFVIYLDDLRFEGNAVPEPGTLALLSIGLFGVAVARRRRP
jgi:PEP-CTERM motif